MHENGQLPFRSLRKAGNMKERPNGERNVCVCVCDGGKILIYHEKN